MIPAFTFFFFITVDLTLLVKYKLQLDVALLVNEKQLRKKRILVIFRILYMVEVI